MNTYLIASEKRAIPVLPELWTLDFTDFENLALNRRIGLYNSLYYQLEFLKQYAKSDFDRAFIPVLEQCFLDMKAFEGAYLFDLNQFEVNLSSAASEYYKDMRMYVLRLEEAHVVFELGYDGEFLLYLDYNDPTFREILESHFNTTKEKANLDKIFQKGVEVYVPPALLPHMVEEESIPVLEDYFNSRLQPVYQFLLEQGQPLDLKPNSFLFDYCFMYEDGKFYSFLLSNYCESSACGELGESYACKVDLSGNLAKLHLESMLEHLTGIRHMLQSHLLDYFYDDQYKSLFKEFDSKVQVPFRFDINNFFYGADGLVRFNGGVVIPDGNYDFTMRYGTHKENLARISTENLEIYCGTPTCKFWTNTSVALVDYIEEFYIEKSYREQLQTDALAKLQDIKKLCKTLGLPYKLGDLFNSFRNR